MLEFEMRRNFIIFEFSISVMVEFLLKNLLILSNNQAVYVYALRKRIENIYNLIDLQYFANE